MIAFECAEVALLLEVALAPGPSIAAAVLWFKRVPGSLRAPAFHPMISTRETGNARPPKARALGLGLVIRAQRLGKGVIIQLVCIAYCNQ